MTNEDEVEVKYVVNCELTNKNSRDWLFSLIAARQKIRQGQGRSDDLPLLFKIQVIQTIAPLGCHNRNGLRLGRHSVARLLRQHLRRHEVHTTHADRHRRANFIHYPRFQTPLIDTRRKCTAPDSNAAASQMLALTTCRHISSPYTLHSNLTPFTTITIFALVVRTLEWNYGNRHSSHKKQLFLNSLTN